MSSDSVHTFKEDVVTYSTYSAAAIASCKFAKLSKEDIPKLELYYGDVGRGKKDPHPGYNKVVGVCLRTRAGTCVDHVRLDIEKPPEKKKAGEKYKAKFKGIHFNARPQGKKVDKLAAILKDTAEVDSDGWPTMSEEKRVDLYRGYLKALEDHSAEFIWKWWSTDKALSDLE